MSIIFPPLGNPGTNELDLLGGADLKPLFSIKTKHQSNQICLIIGQRMNKKARLTKTC